jgi:hypothetical protein
MSFSSFSLFLQKLAFQRSKRQLKSLSFVPAFGFSAFRLKKPAKKQEQTGSETAHDMRTKLIEVHENNSNIKSAKLFIYKDKSEKFVRDGDVTGGITICVTCGVL